jgi:hypothetical protein
MIKRRELMLGGLLLPFAKSASAAVVVKARPVAQTAQAGKVSTLGWWPLPEGAGGFVTGMDCVADGTRVARTDTYGAYIWDSSLVSGNASRMGGWKQLVTLQSIPGIGTDVDVGGGTKPGLSQDGVVEIVIDPSNSNNLWMHYIGWLYKSTNKGATWTKSGYFKVKNPGGNGSSKSSGKFVAIDPNQSSVVYASTFGGGCRMSTDGGTSFSFAPTVPSASRHIICFDSSGGTTTVSGQTRTKNVFVGAEGNGLYVSNDGGQTFTKISGSGTGATELKTFRKMIDGKDGYIWIVDGDNDSGSVWHWRSGSLTQLTIRGGSNGTQAVAVDPSKPARIVAIDNYGYLSVSQDHGSKWIVGIQFLANTTFPPTNRVASDVPWLANTHESFFTVGDIVFDPNSSNKLYCSMGIGVFYCNPPNTDVSFKWTSESSNIEQLVTIKMLCPPGGRIMCCNWDRALIRVPSDTTFPTNQAPDNNGLFGSPTDITYGYDVDYDSGNPNNVVLWASGGIDRSGYSTDGGVTFTRFSGAFPDTAGYGGYIAYAGGNNLARVAGDQSSRIYYTTNKGTSWNLATIPGVATSGNVGWNRTGGSWNSWQQRHSWATDRVLNSDGVYRLYAWNTGSTAPGLYMSSDGGANWSRVFAGKIGHGEITLKSVWGEGGHLFYLDDSGNTRSGNISFSSDGGVTWKGLIANSGQAIYARVLGIGAIYSGQSYPSLCIVGYIRGAAGVFECRNFNPSTLAGTWADIQNPSGSSANPFYSTDYPNDMDGHKDTPGIWYIGMTGSGAVRGTVA